MSKTLIRVAGEQLEQVVGGLGPKELSGLFVEHDGVVRMDCELHPQDANMHTEGSLAPNQQAYACIREVVFPWSNLDPRNWVPDSWKRALSGRKA